MRPLKVIARDRKCKLIIDEALEITNIGLGDGSLLVDEIAQHGHELDWMQFTELLDKNQREIYEGT